METISKYKFLATSVSYYRAGKWTTPTGVKTFADLLENIKYKDKVSEVRQMQDPEERKRAKDNLPKFVPAGIHTHNGQTPTKYSGFVCIDVDFHPGEQEHSPEEVREILTAQPFVSYVGRSCGGVGFFALIPVKEPEAYKQYYETLCTGFALLGVHIDRNAGAVSKFRYISYDPKSYIAESAEIYCTKFFEVLPAQQTARDRQNTAKFAPQGTNTAKEVQTPTESENAPKIANLAAKVIQSGTNITKNYADWVKIAYCFTANLPRSEARKLFHAISAIDERYNEKQTDKLLRSSAADNSGKVGPSSFFDICGKYGIYYKENNYKTDFQNII